MAVAVHRLIPDWMLVLVSVCIQIVASRSVFILLGLTSRPPLIKPSRNAGQLNVI